MESLNTPTAVPAEKFELKLTFTDSKGFTHILDVTKVEGEQPFVEMLGDNIKLVNRLRAALSCVERAEQSLI